MEAQVLDLGGYSKQFTVKPVTTQNI